MKKTAGILAVLFPIVFILASCTSQKHSTPPDEVSLQLKWVHQAQFAGFYVAQEKAYYAQENLKVNFLEGGQGIDHTQAVTTGKADFAVVAPEDIFTLRSSGQALTAIAAIYRRSAVAFVSLENSGITRPEDFPGKAIAAGGKGGFIRDFELQLHAMMSRLGLDIASVRLVPYDPEYVDFLNGAVAVTPVYTTGGLIKIHEKGYKLNMIWPEDYGIHFYSDTLMTTERMLGEKPEIVERFLRASLKGWRDAVGDTVAAVTATLKYARVQDAKMQTVMMEALAPLVHTGTSQIGWMEDDVWRRMHDVLVTHKVLPGPLPDLEKIYTMQFLKKVYGGTTK